MDTMTKRETLTAGDILHCGWGSDMSINDYYEVTRVTPSGKTAYIRPLRKTYAGSPNDGRMPRLSHGGGGGPFLRRRGSPPRASFR